jgi:hypothetical protein
MTWVLLNKLLAKLTGYTTRKAAMQMNKRAARSQAKLNRRLSSEPTNRQQVEREGNLAQQLNEQQSKLTSQRRDLQGGQGVSQQQSVILESTSKGLDSYTLQWRKEHGLPVRRSDLCMEEAKKNRASGNIWLAEMNEALAEINRKKEANNKLDDYLRKINGQS